MTYKTINNGQSHEDTRQRLAESRSLQLVTAALLQRLTLGEVLEIVRKEARHLTGAAGGSIFLLEDDAWLREVSGDAELDPLAERIPVAGTLTGQAVLSGKPMWVNDYASGVVETRTPGLKTESLLAVPLQVEGAPIGALNMANKAGGLAERIPVAGTLTGQAVLSGKPMWVNDYASGVVETRTPGLKTESLLAVPLQVEGAPIGALNMANKAGGFTENDVRILGLFADVAAVAIESARLREKAGRLAIVEERQWLARELHDSVTQAMYSVTLYAQATRMALAAGKQDVAADNLRELQAMAREALVDIRLLIFELHPPILEGKGLAASLKIRLAAVESRAGLQTKMRVDGGRRLPLSVEEELYRIALEALNNVVKHARAQHVTVYLRFDDQRVCLEIADDGLGYDPVKAKESGGMGLRGMEERVQRLNGKLEIRSVLGQGTTVNVECNHDQQS